MLDVRDMFGSLRLSSEKQDRKKCQCNLVPKVLSAPKMAEEVSKTGLLEGTQPRPGYVVPDNPNNEALFHEKGKSPKEVRIQYSRTKS